MRRFANETVLVTGSTSGIGKAVAEAFAHEGAFVLVSGRSEDRGRDVTEQILARGDRAQFLRSDLSGGAAAVTQLADRALASTDGRVDIVVNNAAALVPAQSMFDATEAEIDEAFGLNVKVPFLLTARLAPAMVAAGRGAVVNVGSISGLVGMSVAALYGATKAALHSLTQSWAAELAPLGVNVNAVAPGPTRTDANEAYWPVLRELALSAPDGRPGTAAEVASAVLFLASVEAAHIHGVTLSVDGGATTR